MVSREEIDKRMTSPRIKVTAGLHDIGFTFVERPTQEQNVWQPVLRDSLEAHNPSGIPRLRTGNIEGPYNVTGISETPARKSCSSAGRHPPQRRRPALRRSCPVSRGVPSGGLSSNPTWPRRWPSTMTLARKAATSTPAFAPASPGFWPARPSCSAPRRTPPAFPPAPRIASPILNWRAGCPFSSGAAFPTMNC